MPALDEKDAAAINDHRADTDDRLRRKLPHSATSVVRNAKG
jgi:hypothetical protein